MKISTQFEQKTCIFPNNITISQNHKFTRNKESCRKILLIKMNAKKIEKSN